MLIFEGFIVNNEEMLKKQLCVIVLFNLKQTFQQQRFWVNIFWGIWLALSSAIWICSERLIDA